LNIIFEHKHIYISDFNIELIIKICDYLNLETEFVKSSEIYNNSFLKSEERIIDICVLESVKTYINPIGGLELYSNESFKKNNIQLKFLKTEQINYVQYNNNFVSSLSILDVLMFNNKFEIMKMLDRYSLI
jgi:hypothetical protein